MRFHLSNSSELDRAAEYLSTLAGREATVEIKRVLYKRSLPQNSYLHLILGYFGTQAGYTLEESKELYKEINSTIYQYTKSGRTFNKSSADLNNAEMTKTIDRFREWSSEQGIDLPTPNDTEFLKWCDDQVAANANFL